jgi:DNA-binding LacI/PurR family transcriptional regulator
VQAAMTHLGYKPNRQARALRNGQSKTVGLVIKYFRNNSLSDLLEGMSSTAARLGYGIMFIPVQNDVETTLTNEADYITSFNLDGLLVFSDDDISDAVLSRVGDIPTVVLGSLGSFPASWSYVDTNEAHISELAVSHLLKLGHRTVHHICGPLTSPTSVTRVNAWRTALEKNNVTVPNFVESAEWLPDDGYRAAIKLFEMYPDLTAIYASDDAIASGVMEVCHDRGLIVGNDISLVGVDDTLGSFVPHNILTSVKPDYLAAGNSALRLLIETVRNPEKRGTKTSVFPRLIVRSSTSPAK